MIVKMQKQEIAIQKLKKYNQEHVVKILEELDQKQKKELIEQIIQIDFDKISKLYENTKVKKQIQASKITPIDFIDKEKLNNEEEERYTVIGERNNKK